MKRTIKCLVMAFGPAAVLPLVMACSRPAQTPTGTPAAPPEQGAPAGQTPPPGAGTEVPGQAPTPPGPTGQLGTQEQMGQPQMGQQPGAMGQQQGQMQPGMQGQQQGQQGLGSGLGQQGQQQQPSEGQQPGATTGVNERALCESLATEGRMRVEDAQNGVAIVITPKAGNQLSTIRDDARRLESSIRTGAAGGEGVVGAPQRSVRSGEACGLAELGRLPSVTTQLVESGNSVRIVMTTNNAGEVRDLRRIARDEVNALSKAQGPGQTRQRGGAGQRGGGQQQQPGQQR